MEDENLFDENPVQINKDLTKKNKVKEDYMFNWMNKNKSQYPTLGNTEIKTGAMDKYNFDVDLPEVNLEDSGMSDAGKGAIAGGTALLEEVPGLIANYSNKPKTKEERQAQVLSTTGSGMKVGAAVGTAIGGPVGTLIGAAGGGLAGLFTGSALQSDWQREVLNEERIEKEAELNELKKNRRIAYYNSKNSEQIKAELDLLNRSQGYLTT